MPVTQKSYVINSFTTKRERTTSTGTKARYSLEVKAEEIRVNLDEVALGVPVAVTIKKVIADQIKNISEPASAGTLLARKYAASAYGKGAPWAMKRYSGGRTGATPPGESDRLFNDSGRLANGIFVRGNRAESAFTINVPANRLDESTFRSHADFVAMLDRLGQLVPALGDPESLLIDDRIVGAIQLGCEKVMHQKGRLGQKLSLDVAKAGLELAKSIAELGEIVMDD